MLSFVLRIVVGIFATYMFAYPMVHIAEQIFNHVNNSIGGFLLP
jgi:hypothetical protein